MDNAKRLRARLRKEAQTINERNRVPGDLHYKEPRLTEDEAQLVIGAIPLQVLPPTATREEWRVVHDGPSRPMIEADGRLLSLSQFEDGRWVSYEREESDMAQIVTDHAHAALVPRLVDLLRYLKETAFAVHVNDRHKPDAFAACEHMVCKQACQAWNEATEQRETAARKAGIE